MKTAIAQIAPVFLDRAATLAKVVDWIGRAAAAGCELVCFGETLVPAYPMWLARTDAARFNAADQKQLHALYLDQAVRIPAAHVAPPPAAVIASPQPRPSVSDEFVHNGAVARRSNAPAPAARDADFAAGDLAPVCDAACRGGIAVVLGVAERAVDRGGHSLFCSRVFIGGRGDAAGRILSVHRKLMPTYEERLSWGIGDGAGLVTHPVGPFTVGALNCWENWMPLARAALYAAGEDLHVMLWPGSSGLTRDLTRFVALESRSFVLSAGVLLREQDVPAGVPQRERFVSPGELLYDGGSCIAGPDGRWIVEPVAGREELIVADLDPARVLEERQNFDPAGHYARPDVLRLVVNRGRNVAAEYV